MTDHWTQRLAGRFIVLDGPDGSGKSTQFRRLADLLRRHDLGVEEVREPGGTLIGEHIREVLLNPAHHMMDLRCEMLLYMASRAQLVAEKIRPALARGACVLADRFISSTLAYQGAAGGIPADHILTVGRIAIGDCWPDLTIVLDVDEQTAAHRLNPLLDRIELRGAAFHRKVRQGFLDRAAAQPDRHLVLDARPDPETVFRRLCDGLADCFSASPSITPSASQEKGRR